MSIEVLSNIYSKNNLSGQLEGKKIRLKKKHFDDSPFSTLGHHISVMSVDSPHQVGELDPITRPLRD